MKHTDSEIWDACAEVMERDPKPLPVRCIADATGMEEGEVIAALLRECGPRRRSVSFRFPPLPEAAITAISR